MKASRFFFKHAGYGYDPKTQTKLQGRWQSARALADAEAHAANMGWCFSWEPDFEPWEGEGDAPSEVFGCIVRTEGGEVLASLWGIGDPTPQYSRVIEAELALEAKEEISAAVMSAV